MYEENRRLMREGENILRSINIHPGGMMAYQSGVAGGSECKQEVRKLD